MFRYFFPIILSFFSFTAAIAQPTITCTQHMHSNPSSFTFEFPGDRRLDDKGEPYVSSVVFNIDSPSGSLRRSESVVTRYFSDRLDFFLKRSANNPQIEASVVFDWDYGPLLSRNSKQFLKVEDNYLSDVFCKWDLEFNVKISDAWNALNKEFQKCKFEDERLIRNDEKFAIKLLPHKESYRFTYKYYFKYWMDGLQFEDSKSNSSEVSYKTGEVLDLADLCR